MENGNAWAILQNTADAAMDWIPGRGENERREERLLLAAGLHLERQSCCHLS